MKKLFLASFCLLISLSLLVACSGKESVTKNDKNNQNEKVELSFLYQMDDRWTNEFWANIVDGFENQNPNIKLKPMSYPSVDKKQEYIKTLYATDQLPDVTFAGLEALKLLEDDVFLDLPEHIYSLLDDNAITKRDGKVFTVPTSQYIMLDVFYNKEVFEKNNVSPPNTWDEFIELNETLKKNGVTPFVEGGQGVSGYMLHNPMMTVMLNELDPDYTKKLISGELRFNGPEVTDIAERFQSLWESGYFHEGSLSFTGAQKSERFMDGSAAMVIDGMFNSKLYADGSDFKVGWFPLPAMKSADIYPVMYGEDIGVSSKTEHPEEALKFMEYLLSDKVYQQIIELGNAGSTMKKEFTYDLDYLTKEMYEITKDKTPKLVFMKIEEFPAGTSEAFRTAAQDIAHGGDVKKALDKMESIFREMVESQK